VVREWFEVISHSPRHAQIRATEEGLPIIKVETWKQDGESESRDAGYSADEPHKLKFLMIRPMDPLRILGLISWR
jgi:hypothetical protein